MTQLLAADARGADTGGLLREALLFDVYKPQAIAIAGLAAGREKPGRALDAGQRRQPH